jgi:hypothetical protein
VSSVGWPGSALIALVFLAGAGWLVARSRLLPRRPVRAEERLAGHSGALLALGVVGLLLAATNPFALVFVLPSLHAWLWLPQVQTRHPVLRAVVFLAGLLGPGYLVWTFATHYGLGWDAPWYVAKLFAVGYAPLTLFAIGLGWLAAAGQLAALAAGRYAPYPAPHERPRRGPVRELAVSTWNVHERIGRSGTDDHVRLLAENGLEHELVPIHTRPRTHELVALRVAPEPGAEPAGLVPWQRLLEPLQRSQCGLDEELTADERRDRIAGQPEDERLSAHAERNRLARLDRHAPEDLVDAEVPLGRSDEVVLAHRDAARGDERVGRETSLERLPQDWLVVSRGRLGHHVGAGRGERGGEHERVGLVDLAGAQVAAGNDELAAGRKYGDARAARAPDLGHAGGRCGRQASRREPRPRRHHDFARGDVPASRTDVRAGLPVVIDLYCVVVLDNTLHRNDGVRPLRHDGPGRDGHGRSGFEGGGERAPRGGLADDLQRPRQIARAYGEAVHRRACERREIDPCPHVLCGDTSTGLGDRHELRRKGPGAIQYPLLGLLEGE